LFVMDVLWLVMIFFYRSKQLTDYIYTDISCKLYLLTKCIGQTPCSYEHYLVLYCERCFFTSLS